MRIFGFIISAVAASTVAAAPADTVLSANALTPFITKNCARCHGGKKPKGDLRLDTISLVIAFPVPGSRGTADMIRRATKAGIDTHIFVGHGCKKS
jgi:hypothetical protein